jgi:ketosteroid isomerase-like protein
MRKSSSIVSGVLFHLPLLCLVLFSSVLTAHADNDKAREEAVLKFEHEWSETWLKANVNAMNSMLTDDFIEVAPDGAVTSRADHIAGFSSGKMKFQSLVLSDTKVRFYGDVAVVTGFATTKSTYDGKDTSGKYAFTDVLVFRDGAWKAASTQATKVAP